MERRWLVTLLALGIGLFGSAHAADVTVAVVNALRLQSEAPQVASVREKIKVEFAAREAKTVAQQEQIEQLEQKLLRERDGMSDAEAKSLQRDIRSRTLRLENAKRNSKAIVVCDSARKWIACAVYLRR